MNLLYLSYLTYPLFLILLTAFSYTQLDLNLTLSGAGLYQLIQKKLIYLGYFQRPLSTVILFLFFLISFFYLFIFSKLARSKKLSLNSLKKLILINAITLLFSYPMFSHDIFNYIFDARIFTKYQLNPYTLSALAFPNDSWTRFMHWVHRTDPYPFLWTAYSLIPSYLGLQKFVPTLFLFKLFVGFLPYLMGAYLIYKTSLHLFPKRTKEYLVYFAFSPIIIYETLINSHNDLLMMVVALWAFYLLIKKKTMFSLILIALSGLIKYASFTLLPIFTFFGLKDKKDQQLCLRFSVVFLLLTVTFYSLANEIQPWYFLWILPFLVFLTESELVKTISISVQAGLLSVYLAFFYFGNWDFSVKATKLVLCFIWLGLGLVYVFLQRAIKSEKD